MMGVVNTIKVEASSFTDSNMHYVLLEDWKIGTVNPTVWYKGSLLKGEDIVKHFNSIPNSEAVASGATLAIEKETMRMGLIVKKLRRTKEDPMQIYFDEMSANSADTAIALKAIMLLPYEMLPLLMDTKDSSKEPWNSIIKLRLEQIL